MITFLQVLYIFIKDLVNNNKLHINIIASFIVLDK